MGPTGTVSQNSPIENKNHMHPWVPSDDTERMEWLLSRNAGRQDRVLINRMDEKMNSSRLITAWGEAWGGGCRQDICIDLKVQSPFLPVAKGS